MSEAPVKRKPGRPKKVVTNVESVAGEEAREGEQAPESGGFGGCARDPQQEREQDDGRVHLPEEHEDGARSPSANSPNASKLNAIELDCIHREAWEAFDYDAPRGKTDSTGRIWAFDPDIKGGVKRVSLSVRRVNGDRVEHLIECPAVGYQGFRPDVEACVDLLNEALT